MLLQQRSYGSRGANGVIVITTKKGQTGAPKIDFNTPVGTSNLLRRSTFLMLQVHELLLKSITDQW